MPGPGARSRTQPLRVTESRAPRDMAQAGGVNPEALPQALASVRLWVE